MMYDREGNWTLLLFKSLQLHLEFRYYTHESNTHQYAADAGFVLAVRRVNKLEILHHNPFVKLSSLIAFTAGLS